MDIPGANRNFLEEINQSIPGGLPYPLITVPIVQLSITWLPAPGVAQTPTTPLRYTVDWLSILCRSVFSEKLALFLEVFIRQFFLEDESSSTLRQWISIIRNREGLGAQIFSVVVQSGLIF